jgi:hypothetical protein
LIVGIVGFRYIRSWDKRERIVRAALLHLSHTFTRVVSGVSPWHCCAWTFPCAFRPFHAQNEIAPSASLRQGAPPFGQPRYGQAPRPFTRKF